MLIRGNITSSEIRPYNTVCIRWDLDIPVDERSMQTGEREPSGDYSSIDELGPTMESSFRNQNEPPPIPICKVSQGQNEYMNPMYRPCACHGHICNVRSGDKKKKCHAEWWVWILMGLMMAIIILVLLVLVFIFHENCGSDQSSNCTNVSGSDTRSCASAIMSRHVNFSCADLRLGGVKTSGIYTIYPKPDKPKDVYCDMDINGGGWTVMHSRFNGEVDFNRRWRDYHDGFGSPPGEYWLGLELIHLLTSDDRMELYVALTDWNNITRYAQYSYFHVAPEISSFLLVIAGFSGDAGNGLSTSSLQVFQTEDHYPRNPTCPQNTRSVWWFRSCYSNLNGEYLMGSLNATEKSGMVWPTWRGNKYSLKKAKMMLRPKSLVDRLIDCAEAH